MNNHQTANVRAALKNFNEAAQILCQEWQKAEQFLGGKFISKYPFPNCFHEITIDIAKWTRAATREIKVPTPIKTLCIDNEVTCSPEELILTNSQPDVTPFTDEEIVAIHQLKVGEKLYFGMSTEVKRIK